MTREEILAMPAGREMDGLIAEKVMSLKVDYEFPEPFVPALRDKYDEWGILPNYSIDISAAWEILEKFDVFRITKTFGLSGEKWIVKIGETEVFENTAPLAICRAALLENHEN